MRAKNICLNFRVQSLACKFCHLRCPRFNAGFSFTHATTRWMRHPLARMDFNTFQRLLLFDSSTPSLQQVCGEQPSLEASFFGFVLQGSRPLFTAVSFMRMPKYTVELFSKAALPWCAIWDRMSHLVGCSSCSPHTNGTSSCFNPRMFCQCSLNILLLRSNLLGDHCRVLANPQED